MIAIDPDIPAGRQWVEFAASPQSPNLRWELNGESFKASDGQVLWQPVLGRHQLILLDATGQELDRVQFEVRGGSMR